MESNNSSEKKNLRRFHSYDALFSHNMDADKVTAMLYTLADKFLDEEDLNEIKEAIIMTRLGQMIMMMEGKKDEKKDENQEKNKWLPYMKN